MIFCKAPIAGQVKTRLIPSLGEDAACSLHKALATKRITDCLTNEITSIADVYLWCSSELNHPFFEMFDVVKKRQEGENLGQRMAQAFESEDRPGILIGTDCPNLTVDYLRKAIQQLPQYEAIIGPAEDGGYGLIGMNKPTKSVFQKIKWGTSDVCADTCKLFNARYDNWGLLPLLWDVDREADVLRYKQFVGSDDF